MSGDTKPKVSVEDLLRLKREERPAPEFWSRFDRELRAKQLAALVEKRPWWHGLPAWALNWRRYHLPLGATAVLAVTIIALRDGGDGDAFRRTASRSVAVPVVAKIEAKDGVGLVAAPAAHSEAASVAVVAVPNAVAMISVASDESPVADGALDAVEAASATATESPDTSSARFAGGRVLASLESESTLGRGLVGMRDLKAPAVRGATLEPLAQMSSPTEVRRARYRTAMAIPVARETVAQANDRLARSLSDERMNDTIRRFDAKADRLSLKF